MSPHELRLVLDDVAKRVLIIAHGLLQSRPQIVVTSDPNDDGRGRHSEETESDGDSEWIRPLVQQILFQALFDGTIDGFSAAEAVKPTAKDASKREDTLVLPLLSSEAGRSTAYEVLGALVSASAALLGTVSQPPCGVEVVLEHVYLFCHSMTAQQLPVSQNLFPYASVQSPLPSSKSTASQSISPASVGVDFAGLTNLGCTCYMNSVLQQLFLLPVFRESILSLSLPAATAQALQPHTENAPSDENPPMLLMQLQRILSLLTWRAEMSATMRMSSESVGHNRQQRSGVYTRSFCAALKGWGGRPIHLGEQQDASEFFTRMLDQLETEQKPSEHLNKGSLPAEKMKDTETVEMRTRDIKQVVRECFAIRIHTELSASLAEGQPPRRKQLHSAPAPFLSLDVRGCTNVLESMARWCADEVIEYTWEADPGSLDNDVRCDHTLKTTALEKPLPPVLLLHLKRFEYDYQNDRTIKVHDEYRFPLELDMSAFVWQDDAELGGDEATDEDEHCKYELRGVVIHTGSAQGGHYYSYSRGDEFVRRDTDSEAPPPWFEFNDLIVKPFDAANDLETEAFGGKEQLQRYANSNRPGTVAMDRIRSAFMLVYRRKQPSSSPPDPIPTPSVCLSRPREALSATRGHICNLVWREQMASLRYQLLFDVHQFVFVDRVLTAVLADAIKGEAGRFNAHMHQQAFKAALYFFVSSIMRVPESSASAGQKIADANKVAHGRLRHYAETIAYRLAHDNKLRAWAANFLLQKVNGVSGTRGDSSAGQSWLLWLLRNSITSSQICCVHGLLVKSLAPLATKPGDTGGLVLERVVVEIASSLTSLCAEKTLVLQAREMRECLAALKILSELWEEVLALLRASAVTPPKGSSSVQTGDIFASVLTHFSAAERAAAAFYTNHKRKSFSLEQLPTREAIVQLILASIDPVQRQNGVSEAVIENEFQAVTNRVRASNNAKQQLEGECLRLLALLWSARLQLPAEKQSPVLKLATLRSSFLHALCRSDVVEGDAKSGAVHATGAVSKAAAVRK